MSVTFFVEDHEELEFTVANSSARDILEWLGLPAEELVGAVPARDLTARCRRRLWDEPRNFDPGKPSIETTGILGARLIECGRESGYLRQRTEQLLALAEAAGDGSVAFG